LLLLGDVLKGIVSTLCHRSGIFLKLHVDKYWNPVGHFTCWISHSGHAVWLLLWCVNCAGGSEVISWHHIYHSALLCIANTKTSCWCH